MKAKSLTYPKVSANKAGRKSGSTAGRCLDSRKSGKQTAKKSGIETAKARRPRRSRTANAAGTKPLGSGQGEVRWSRPSPRSGVRLPLGAHPWNTGGKPGRSGRKRLTPAEPTLFGAEYFDQPATSENLSLDVEQNREPEHVGKIIARMAESDPTLRRALRRVDELDRRPQINEEVEESSDARQEFAARGTMLVGDPPLFKLAGRRVVDGPEVRSDWDPFEN